MPNFYKLTIKRKDQDTIENVVPLNTDADVTNLGSLLLNLRAVETAPQITLEYLTEQEANELAEQKNNKNNEQPTQTDEFGNVSVVDTNTNKPVDASIVRQQAEASGREDAEGNPLGTELSPKEASKKSANADKQRKAAQKAREEQNTED